MSPYSNHARNARSSITQRSLALRWASTSCALSSCIRSLPSPPPLTTPLLPDEGEFPWACSIEITHTHCDKEGMSVSDPSHLEAQLASQIVTLWRSQTAPFQAIVDDYAAVLQRAQESHVCVWCLTQHSHIKLSHDILQRA